MALLSPESLAASLDVAGYRPGDRFELAAIPAERRGIFTVWARYDPQGLDRAVGWLAPREGQQNLYLLANPLRPDAKKRRQHRAEEGDCASAHVLLLDVDPVKVRQRDVDAGKAAPEDLDELGTRAEKLAAAEEVATELHAFLAARLGVDVALVSSGRGRQLWLRLEEVPRLVRKRLVRALAQRFDRPGLATLDRSTHNAARLMRLPGPVNLRTGARAEVLSAGDGRRARAEDVLALVDELDPPRARRRPVGRDGSRHQAGQRAPHGGDQDLARVESALAAIPADDYETWIAMGMALASSSLPDAYGAWDRWSATGSSYQGQAETSAKWASFSADGGTTMGTLFHLAIEHGWTPPAPTRREEELLPLLDVTPAARAFSTPAEAAGAVRSLLRQRRRRGKPGRVVQDRRPTGAGKTTGAARELVAAVAEEERARYLWASPSHDLARAEVLPALARAGAAIWDEDLDGGEAGGVRAQLEALGAQVLPVGEPPRDPHTPVAVKVAPFACPGPAVADWTPEIVDQLYAEAAARGWNPTATVCRACPRFLGEHGDPCTYWERRRLAGEADVLVVPHHALKGDTDGRSGVVIDEDPAGALVRRLQVDERGARAFLVLVEAAVELVASETQHAREELEQLAAAAEGAERVVGRMLEVLAEWGKLGRELLDVYELRQPDGLELDALGDLATLGRACERVLRELAKEGERLTDAKGNRVGSVRNLLPFVSELARVWSAGRGAVLHTKRWQGGGLGAVLPAVERLPELPTLALDATGDPSLLELATGRPVELIEGELTGALTGVHLVDVPCGRRRWRHRKKRAARGGRTSSEALEADVGVIVRHARRAGARRVGLVTFKFVRDEMAEAFRRAGLEVRALHYGGEVGSNAFAGWADLVVVAGTPFVPPEEVRLRAALEGAGVEELLASPEWQLRRLPGGGTASVLVHPGEATRRAYSALVRARLEQSLGRAMRWDWVPRCGVLVLAEPWPTRHQLRLSTRHREALDGPAADVYELLDRAGALGEGRAALERAEDGVRRLVVAVGGAARAADLAGVSKRAVRYWIAGDRLPDPANVSDLIESSAGVGSKIRDENRDGIAKPVQPNHYELIPDFGTDPLRDDVFKGSVPKSGMSCNPSKEEPTMTTPASALVEEALHLAGGKTRHLAAAIGFKPDTIRRWRRDRELGAQAREALEAFVAQRRAERLAPAEPQAEELVELLVDTGQARDGALGVVVEGGRGPVPTSFPSTGCEACGGLVGPARCWGPAEKCLRVGSSVELEPGAVVLEPPTADEPGLAAVPSVPGEPGQVEEQLVELPAGSSIPGVGRVYTDVHVPPEQAATARAPLTPAPPPEPTKAEEVSRGLEELRGWVDGARHPGWLLRATRRAKGLSSFVTWLGTRKRGEGHEVDQDLALARTQQMQQDLAQPLYARRLWGHAGALLIRRGAQGAPSSGEGQAKRGRLRAARAGAVGDPDCKACGGSGRSSSGGECYPCVQRRGAQKKPTQADYNAQRAAPLRSEPMVQEAANVLEAQPVRRGRR